MSCNALEPVEIVAYRHCQGEEFRQRFLWLAELNRDSPGVQPNPSGQIVELLVDDLLGCFNHQARAFNPLLAQASNDLRYLPPALYFVVALVALGHPPQVGNEEILRSQSVGSDAIAYTRRHDLLGTPPSDSKQKFNGRAIDERAGKRPEFLDDAI